MGRSAGDMATMLTVNSRMMRSGLRALLVLAFLAAQVTALSHELEHVMGTHGGPCALHVAADHLVMAAVPEPAAVARLAILTGPAAPAVQAPRPAPERSRPARAPPLLP
jgi:hypothetical protein